MQEPSLFFLFVRYAKEMTLVEQDLCRAARKEAGAIKNIVQRRLTVDAFAEGSLINEVAWMCRDGRLRGISDFLNRRGKRCFLWRDFL